MVVALPVLPSTRMRAQELGSFLRSRRSRVDPAALGFPTGRRRSDGLRREELAALAGVTVSWLAKLEQGRAHAVSADVLDAISRALNLDPVERRHLLALAGFKADETVDGHPPAWPDAVGTALRTLVDSMDPNPAYVLDRTWHMVAWNAAEVALFPTLADHVGQPPNLLELIFCDPRLAVLMADHDVELERLVSQFRLHCADWPDDPALDGVVSRLRQRSSRFERLWAAGDVAAFTSTRRRFHHPVAGEIELDHHRLAVLDRPGMQLVVYTAAPGTDIAWLTTGRH